MKHLSHSVLASSIGAFLLSTAASGAWAQAPVPPTRPVTPPDISQATPPARDGSNRVSTVGQGTISLCPFASSTIPVTINKVEIVGSSVLTAQSIDKTYADIRGQPTTLAAVCDIRERLIVEYRRLGFPLTRIELPEQRIGAEGTIRFHAVEAGLANVRVTDNGKVAPFTNIVEAYADRLRDSSVGQPLKWANVERFALLMRDTPGVVARLELRPGATEPAVQVTPPADGAEPVATPPAVTPSTLSPLDLFVTVEPPERFGGFIGLQRNSADVFGRYAGVVGGQIRGVMPWGGDELSGVLYSTQTGRQAVGSLSYEWRHGSGLLLKGMAAYAETRPGRAFAPLDLKGQSTSFTLSASYPFILRSAFQMEGVAGLDYVDQDNFIFEDQTISNDKVRVASLKMNTLWRDVQNRRTKASLNIEYRQGLDFLDATQEGDPLLSRIGADPQAPVWRVRGEAEVRIRRNQPGVSVAVDAQLADDQLVSFEQYQVGNLTFVRGVDPGTVTGDRGYGGRLELLGGRYSVTGNDQFQAEPFGFFDAAHVESLAIGAITPKQDLTSYGGGLRLRYSDRVAFEVGGAKAENRPPQFLMNLTYQF